MSEPKEPALPPDENQIIAERRAKLAALRATGPAFPNDFQRTHLADELHVKYGARDRDTLAQENIQVAVAGRMMLKRLMGKASFATVQDGSAVCGGARQWLLAGARRDVENFTRSAPVERGAQECARQQHRCLESNAQHGSQSGRVTFADRPRFAGERRVIDQGCQRKRASLILQPCFQSRCGRSGVCEID
jgi:lysyl-tRNA synthetase class II